jgi:zinc-ribbon domain
MATNRATPEATKVILGCSKCGAALPDEAQFCLKCGKPVSVPPKDPIVERQPDPQPVRVKPRRHYVRWILLTLLLAGLVWAATSDNPWAQGLQELAGFKHDQEVLDNSFTVTPHNFRYYKFALPEGSVNVSIIGQFSAQADKTASRANAKTDSDDNGIEVYVLSEEAFAVWQNGYATSSVYESGKTSQGKVEAELPAGAGIYYLIFSNKSSQKTAKNIQANVSLRYKSWLPEWFRRMKGRLWNWLGL